MNAKVKQRWLAEFRKDNSGYPELLAKDLFEDWERDTGPAWRAWMALGFATTNYCAGDPHNLAGQFLDRAKAVCDRIIAEKRWDSPRCKGERAMLRGQTYRVKAYLHIFADGHFDLNSLSEGSLSYEEWCLVSLKGRWNDDLVQDMYMTAILLALFGDDRHRARKLLERKKTYHYHIDFLNILKNLMENSNATPWPKLGNAFEQLQAHFDNVRNPEYRSPECSEITLRRLELGFIREKYYESKAGKLDWRHVIEMISE